jgi:DNA-binding XRE family transcriptional regulator
MKTIRWLPAPDFIGWNKVKALRKERGLTQPEVAVGSGISIACLYYLEAGFESRATQKTKSKLAKFFGVEVDDLFPCEMIGNEPRDLFITKAKKQAGQPKTK